MSSFRTFQNNFYQSKLCTEIALLKQFLVVFSFFEKTTYCCRARRLSVRLSVRPSVRLSVRLWK